MPRSLFITGTDTGVGKTLVSCALIHALKVQGLKVAGMKPVASGSEQTSAGLRNADALALQQAANVTAEYSLINPYCFAPAIAPHLAARQVGVSIQLPVLLSAYQQLQQRADCVVVEGAGGWRVPLEPAGYLSEFPEALQLNVILVVGLRLGCLNHALLTAEAIQSGPCRLLGWVGNSVDAEFAQRDENLATLTQRLAAPCLGVIPHAPGANGAAGVDAAELRHYLRLTALLQ
jgi:dethiobiotin synthetase